jgi:hypothetical protein
VIVGEYRARRVAKKPLVVVPSVRCRIRFLDIGFLNTPLPNAGKTALLASVSAPFAAFWGEHPSKKKIAGFLPISRHKPIDGKISEIN